MYLNDVCLHRETVGHCGSGELPVGQWIIPGSNTLSLEAQPVQGSISFDQDSQCVIELNSYQDASTQGLARLLVSVNDFQEANALRFTESKEPVVTRSVSFESLPATPLWLWLAATPFQPDKDRTLLENLVSRFHTALSQRDFDALDRVLELRNQELAASRRITFEQQRQETRAEFERHLLEGWDVGLLDFSACEVVLSAEGRLAHLETPDGESPLYLESKDMVYFLNAVIAKSNSDCLIVR